MSKWYPKSTAGRVGFLVLATLLLAIGWSYYTSKAGTDTGSIDDIQFVVVTKETEKGDEVTVYTLAPNKQQIGHYLKADEIRIYHDVPAGHRMWATRISGKHLEVHVHSKSDVDYACIAPR